MTTHTLAFPRLDGTEPSAWFATLGAARLLAVRWPALRLHWAPNEPYAGYHPVFTGGPATVEEAADVIRDESLGKVPHGGVLPGCPPLWPPAGRDWYGPHGEQWQLQEWPPGAADWQAYLVTLAGQLHPMFQPHAQQTPRGMIAAMVRELATRPELLAAGLNGLSKGLTRDYPAGLWMLRRAVTSADSPTGRPQSEASPGRDWLAVMALPWLGPSDGYDDQRRPVAPCWGWQWSGPPAAPWGMQVAFWWLWLDDRPVSAVPAMLAATGTGHRRAGEVPCGAVRPRRRSPQDPPYLRPLSLREVAAGACDESAPLVPGRVPTSGRVHRPRRVPSR